MAGAGAAWASCAAGSGCPDRVYAKSPTIASTATMAIASSGVKDRPGSDGGVPAVDDGVCVCDFAADFLPIPFHFTVPVLWAKVRVDPMNFVARQGRRLLVGLAVPMIVPVPP